MNKVILIGRLANDPTLRKTKDGIAVAQFALAVDRLGQKERDYLQVVAWRKLAEVCEQHLNKGRLVAVEGRIQTRNYENAEGRKVYVTEVVAENVRFLDYANDGYSENEKRHQTLQNDVEDDFDPFGIV